VQEICPLRSMWRGLESTGGGQHCGRALPERRQSSTLPTRPGVIRALGYMKLELCGHKTGRV
jgi:hypothetical protein